MKFKHRSLIYSVAVGTFLAGLANGALFCFNRELHTAIVGSLCIFFGLAYIMILRISSGSEQSN